MTLGVFGALEKVLAVYSNVAIAWVGALVADLVINKPLGLSPPHIEFRARTCTTSTRWAWAPWCRRPSSPAVFAYGGPAGRDGGGVLALHRARPVDGAGAAAGLGHRGRYYLARQPSAEWQPGELVRCVVCENQFESEDMAAARPTARPSARCAVRWSRAATTAARPARALPTSCAPSRRRCCRAQWALPRQLPGRPLRHGAAVAVARDGLPARRGVRAGEPGDAGAGPAHAVPEGVRAAGCSARCALVGGAQHRQPAHGAGRVRTAEPVAAAGDRRPPAHRRRAAGRQGRPSPPAWPRHATSPA
jgi:hypothetical protein